jgi:hypothetical protein
LLSSLDFGSFLSYSPRGTSVDELASRSLCHQIKRDGHLLVAGRPAVSAIAHAVKRLRQSITPDLAELLTPGVLFVPVPRSAPFPPGRANGLWVPRRICEELLQAGFGARIEALLLRRIAVPKSAFAVRSDRPGVALHHASFQVAPRLIEPSTRITLVDDVITKGSTLLAGASRLAEAFPDATIQAFALVRTLNPADSPRGRRLFRALVDPIRSKVTLTRYGAWRRDP